MTRIAPFAALLIAACSGEEVARSDLANGTYAGPGRNRLCIDSDGPERRAGLIVYGAYANCSASGRLEPSAAGWTLVPRGEGDCRIAIEGTADELTIGAVPAACSYYCGPGATLAGQSFRRNATGRSVADFGGDPLC